MAPPSFAFALMREAVLGLAQRHAAVRSLINPRQTHAIAYTHSPLNASAKDASGSDTHAFSQGPAPGTVLPECRLIRRTDDDAAGLDIHLTDLLAPCFTALRFGADTAQDSAWQQLQDTLAQQRIPFNVVRLMMGDMPGVSGAHVLDPAGRLHHMLDATPGTVYLIRPDGHVLARWRDGSAAATLRALSATLTI